MFDENSPRKERRRKIVLQPIVLPQFFLVFLLTLVFLPFFLIFYGVIFRYGLGIPLPLVFIIVWVSLVGGVINFPLKEFKVNQPVLVSREISFFGFRWVIPEVVLREQKMIVAINLGGAIIPILVSAYLLLYTIPIIDPSPPLTYMKIAILTFIIALVVNKFSRIVPGVGIMIPGFIPPLLTAVLTIIIFPVFTPANPYIIGYVSGSLGTLIGADLLNIKKFPNLRAGMISIGGAGTFDGIYLTGVMAVFLILLLTT
ncbi:MAG: DUF1614 domain-containing protein [Candidatus Bathyarchaeota archaeon]|nr:DUF1614 domain-containing protein [Candidatus Bathyarchaeota archaeon]